MPLTGMVTIGNRYNLFGDLLTYFDDLTSLSVIQSVAHLATHPPSLAFLCSLSIKSPLPNLFCHGVVGFIFIIVLNVTHTFNGLADLRVM